MSYRYTPPSSNGGRDKKTSWLDRLLVGLENMFSRRKTKGSRPRVGLAGEQRLWKAKHFAAFTGKALVLFLSGLFFFWGGYTLLLRSDIFRLTELRMSGTKILSERQLYELTGITRGINLLTLNLTTAAKSIATHPWVRTANLSRQWPSGLTVEIEEYKPFALVNLVSGKERRLWYLDTQGKAFAEVEEGAELDYPVLSGVRQDELHNNQLIPGGMGDKALSLLHLAAKGNAVLPLQSVSEVRVAGDTLVLYLLEQPFPIFFVSERLSAQFNDLLRVLKKIYDADEIESISSLETYYGGDANKILCRLSANQPNSAKETLQQAVKRQ